MFKYFLLWFPMILIAIVNGAARDVWYKYEVGELAARQISTFSLIILLGIYMFFVFRKYPPQSAAQSLSIGLLWVVLTLCFEFGFGRFRGNSWAQLLDDYNVMKGHLWLLVPVWIIFAPYLLFKSTQNRLP